MNNPTTAVATRFYELYGNGEIDRVLDLLGGDYVSHGFGGGGRENLRQSLEGFRAAFPDLTFTVEDTITEGDKVAVKTTFRGTHRGQFAGVAASGNPIEVGGCDVFRVRDGKIVEAWWLGDSGSMLMQIGAVPVPGGGS
jgi:steroid delta-isomerase-like uncharacterized protein